MAHFYIKFYSSFWIRREKWPTSAGKVTVTSFWRGGFNFLALQPSHLNCTSSGHFLTYRDGEYHFGDGRHCKFFLARNRIRAGTGTGSGNALKLPYFWTTFGLTWHYNNWSSEALESFTSSSPNHTTPYGGLGRCIWSPFWPIFGPCFKGKFLKLLKMNQNTPLHKIDLLKAIFDLQRWYRPFWKWERS